MNRRRTVGLAAVGAAALVLAACAPPGPGPGPSTRYVATTGTDTGTCSTSATACATLSYAIAQAVDGDTVDVAAGAYPERPIVDKDLTFSGANSGVAAGVDDEPRGAESVIAGLRSADDVSITVDGFRVDPQGDSTLIAASGTALVELTGDSDTTSIINNVFHGGPFEAGCSHTCTTMTDYAVSASAGDVSFADNTVANFRRPLNLRQSAGQRPLVGSVTDNAFSGVTSRAISLFSATGASLAAATITGNSVDATGRVLPSSPAGVVITNAGNTISDNAFTGLANGVYINLCKLFDTRNNTITNNEFTNNSLGVSIAVSAGGGACLTGTGGVDQAPVVAGAGEITGSSITNNNFSGSAAAAIRHLPVWIWGTPVPVYSTGPIDATCNWYGSLTGPTNPVNPGGIGDVVQFSTPPNAAFDLVPWRGAPSPTGGCTGGL